MVTQVITQSEDKSKSVSNNNTISSPNNKGVNISNPDQVYVSEDKVTNMIKIKDPQIGKAIR